MRVRHGTKAAESAEDDVVHRDPAGGAECRRVFVLVQTIGLVLRTGGRLRHEWELLPEYE